MIGSFVFNLAMSSSLGALWEAINSIQIISHLTDFNAYVPANSDAFHKALISIADFEVLPSNLILGWFGLTHENTDSEES